MPVAPSARAAPWPQPSRSGARCGAARTCVCSHHQGGGAARSIFSIGWRQTTQIGLGPCSTFSAHSTHMAMCPHGTSNAERGSSRQTAHLTRVKTKS